MTHKDINKFIDLSDSYTDFDQEGRNLLFEMNETNRKTINFIDGTKYSVNPNSLPNFRSQEGFLNWMDHSRFGPRGLKLELSIRQYIKNI